MKSSGVAQSREMFADIFAQNFRERRELGASVSVWQGEEEIVSLAGGSMDREQTRAWTEETLVPVWSATKGPTSLACLLALDEAGLSLEDRVCKIWPCFAAAGKGQITFGQVLSHTAGLFALDRTVSITDYEAVTAAIEEQAPIFTSGTRQAYHARTFGFILDKIVRYITGAKSLGQYLHEIVMGPLGADFWIGLPSEQFSRVASLYPGKLATAAPDAFLQAINTRGSLTQRAFQSPAGLNSIQHMNQRDTWALGLASMGGVGTASALGKFYAMLANGGRWGGKVLVPESVIRLFPQTISQGMDGVLCSELAFSAGMMRDPVDADGKKTRAILGKSISAFGHPGAGGSLCFADPERGLSFSYVMNQMEVGVLPGEKALKLVKVFDQLG